MDIYKVYAGKYKLKNGTFFTNNFFIIISFKIYFLSFLLISFDIYFLIRIFLRHCLS